MKTNHSSRHLSMKNIMKNIIEFLVEKIKLLFVITTLLIITCVLGLVACCVKSCVLEIAERTEAKNVKTISYLVQNPRTLNGERPEWITLGYKDARIYGDYIHFKLDGKSYSTKNFFQVNNDQ